MSKDVETIQFKNDDGDYVYAKSHVDAIDGIDTIQDDIIALRNETFKVTDDIKKNVVSGTGWNDYDVRGDLDKNKMYGSSGFDCGIKQTVASSTQTAMSIKSIRVNIRGFGRDEQIAQIPSGFAKETQVFWARGGNGYQPIMVQVQADGKIIPRLMVEDVNNPPASNWIYAQFTWIE